MFCHQHLRKNIDSFSKSLMTVLIQYGNTHSTVLGGQTAIKESFGTNQENIEQLFGYKHKQVE